LQAAPTPSPENVSPGSVPVFGVEESDAADSPHLPAAESSPGDHGMDDYRRLQRRLILATALATALAVPITALLFGAASAGSLLLGGMAGLLYLFLLSRSVSRLGVESKSVSKVQLLVPVVLVLAAARVPQLQILPALVGFLLYKPALILQAVLDA
jgi:ATP synthase protein I